MPVSDGRSFLALAEAELPSPEALAAEVQALAERVTSLLQAPVIEEEYRGPVLFEGDAAGHFFAATLLPYLGAPEEPIGGRGRSGQHPFRDKVGQRILPKTFTVVDDPTVEEFGGARLLGAREIDDDGMRGERVVLVEKGLLKTFCTSRIPTRKTTKSNGHSQNGSGEPSLLFFESSETLDAAALREELLQLGRDEGLPFVYVARKLATPVTALLNPRAFAGMRSMLPPPVVLVRVSVEDGSETLVRGARFGSLTHRVLRDVEAAGDDAAARLVPAGPRGAAHLVCPSVLVNEIEVVKPPEEHEKPPALPNPYFERT
jgi:predicted Zn-dependent protease